LNLYVIAGALAIGVIAGWQANGVRYGLQIAEAELAYQATEKATADNAALALWVADKHAQQEMSDAETKSAAFERCIDTGAGCGLRVKTRTIAAVFTGEAAGVGAGVEQTAELDPAARQDYRALRAGIIRTEQALKVCIAAGQN